MTVFSWYTNVIYSPNLLKNPVISFCPYQSPTVDFQEEYHFFYFLRHRKSNYFTIILQIIELNQLQNQVYVAKVAFGAAVLFYVGTGEGAAPHNVVPAVEGKLQLKTIAL